MADIINKINIIFFSGTSWRKLLLFFLLILFPTLSLSAQKNKLTRFCQETFDGIACGYSNKEGDTIVQAGKYNNLPEKIKKPIIVQYTMEPNKWVMVDDNGLEMYQIYALGEDPDNFNEGLLRIIRQDKIGFINRKGQIVIFPKYCQATPFFKGKSIANINATKVDKSTTDTQNSISWEGGNWGVIDIKGNVVKSFDYTRVWNDSIESYQYQKEEETFIFTQKGEIFITEKK